MDIAKKSRQFFATKVDGRTSIKLGKKGYLNFPKLVYWVTLGFVFYAGSGILGDYHPEIVNYLKLSRIVWIPCFLIFFIYWAAVFCNDFVITRPGDVDNDGSFKGI